MPALEAGPSLAASAWRYKWLIVILVLVGAAAGTGVAAMQPRLYQGVARVLPPPVVIGPDNPAAVDPVRSLQNQAAIMSSAPVLDLVARQFGEGTTVELLRKRVSVEAAQDSDVLTVKALHRTPEGAARLADTVVSAYAQTVGEQNRQDVNASLSTLRQQRQQLGGRLDQLGEERADRPRNEALKTEEQAVSEEYQSLLSQEYELQIALEQAGLSEFVERSPVPERPEQPKPLLLIAGGMLLMLAVGLLLARHRNAARLRRVSRGAPGAGQEREPTSELPELPGDSSALPAPQPDPSARRMGNGAPARAADLRGAGHGGLMDVMDKEAGQTGGAWEGRRPQRSRPADAGGEGGERLGEGAALRGDERG